MSRSYNFAAGPAMLPESVLIKAQEALFDWQSTGVSIMEIGHRTANFKDMLIQTEQKLRELMNIPANYKVLFLTGGGQGQFSLVPMNLTKNNDQVDYFITGIWSERAAKYAARYAKVNIVTTATKSAIPDKSSWNLNSNAAYVYYCPNETINGIQFAEIPETGNVPLVVDMTSSILSEAIDVSRFGLIFAAAQKNLGIAGITTVIIRDDLLDLALDIVPEVFSYKEQALQGSLLNTLPTMPAFMLGLMLDWIIDEQGGLANVVEANKRKVAKIYAAVDNSNGFYTNSVESKYRSQVNIPFSLPSEDLLEHFLAEANQYGLKYLNGHKLVGGARASIYNAMPEAGVDKLVNFMQQFAAKHAG